VRGKQRRFHAGAAVATGIECRWEHFSKLDWHSYGVIVWRPPHCVASKGDSTPMVAVATGME